MLRELIRKLSPKPRRELKTMFLPVIFANGEDDDTPGFIAAMKEEPVQFDEKIYEPGERIDIVCRQIRFRCGTLHIEHIEQGRVVGVFKLGGWPGRTVRAQAPARAGNSVRIFLDRCHITMGEP